MSFGNRLSAAKTVTVPLQPETLPGRPTQGMAAVRRAPSEPDEDSIIHYLSILGRNKALLAAMVLIGGVVAVVLTRVQTPIYRAQMSVEVATLNQDFLNIRSVTPIASVQPFEAPEYSVNTQTIVIQSTPVLERALGRNDLAERVLAAAGEARRTEPGPQGEKGAEEDERDRAVAVAARALKVKVQPSTRVMNLSFDSADPKVAADMANSIAEACAELNRERRSQELRNTREWLTQQLQDMRAKLARSDLAALEYARRANLGIVSEQNSLAAERLREVQGELGRAHADRVAKQSRYELARSSADESLPEVLDDHALREYQTQLTALRRQLADYSSTFAAGHPKMVKVKAEIATVEAALQRSRDNIVARIQNEYDGAVRRESLLSRDYASQLQTVNDQADRISQFLLLRREADANRHLYDSLVQKVNEAGIASALTNRDVYVIQPASPPGAPYKPNIALNTLFGSFSGLCVGVALAIGRAKTVRGVETAREAVVDLDVQELGAIPRGDPNGSRVRRLLEQASVNGVNGGSAGRELATWKGWPSTMQESFRQTLISILRTEVNDGRRPVIAISSVAKGEGKTTIAGNLGIALAQIDCNVLLVDGNLRDPRLHEIFRVDNSAGFSDALAGEGFVSGRRTSIPGLYVLPGGRHRDERLLFSSQMQDVLRRLRNEFEIILIDTPPLLPLPDARLIAIRTDAVILVVSQQTDRSQLSIAKQRLEEDGSRLLGAILNSWEPKNGRLVS